MNKKTFESELRRLGWTINGKHDAAPKPPSMTKLLSENENFSRIFNNFPFQKIDSNITLPA